MTKSRVYTVDGDRLLGVRAGCHVFTKRPDHEDLEQLRCLVSLSHVSGIFFVQRFEDRVFKSFVES